MKGRCEQSTEKSVEGYQTGKLIVVDERYSSCCSRVVVVVGGVGGVGGNLEDGGVKLDPISEQRRRSQRCGLEDCLTVEDLLQIT